MIRYLDAHNHLQDERFGNRCDEIMAAATASGVARMVVNGSCEGDWEEVRLLSMRFAQVIPGFGYHPWHLAGRSHRWLDVLTRLLDQTPGAVIGEIGLDRWKPGLEYDGQEEIFVAQLELAASRNIAASIHCLKAWGRMHDLLRNHARPARGFLLHSYGGPVEMVQPLSKLGACFSFPGYFLHERKARQRETFRQIPLDRLLVETDAPDQCLPDPMNPLKLTDGATGRALNHPANLPGVYKGLAGLLDMSVVQLASQVEANFKRLFG